MNFDRSVHEANELRRKANMVRKLRYAALIFYINVTAVRKQVVPVTNGMVREIDRDSFVLQLPKEFDEAREYVDIFQVEALTALANVRYNSLSASFSKNSPRSTRPRRGPTVGFSSRPTRSPSPSTLSKT